MWDRIYRMTTAICSCCWICLCVVETDFLDEIFDIDWLRHVASDMAVFVMLICEFDSEEVGDVTLKIDGEHFSKFFFEGFLYVSAEGEVAEVIYK